MYYYHISDFTILSTVLPQRVIKANTFQSQHEVIFARLTVIIDGVDEPDPYMCMVICNQDDVEEFFTLWVQLSQTSVDRLQSL